MTTEPALAAAVRDAGIDARVERAVPLSGGCIQTVLALTLSSGDELVAKTGGANDLGVLLEEAASLDALAATETVLVPDRLAVGQYAGTSVLLMSRVPAGGATDAGWTRFGRGLAALHEHDAAGPYGFDMNNHLGTTEQRNDWCDDWVEFNRACRLGPQIELAHRRGLVEPGEMRRLERLLDRLGELLPARPKPSLLHGDLWSGNALPTRDDDGATVAVIDPACSIGDGLADIAMMQLFGGFSAACYDAYLAERGETLDATRLHVYQLYHVLNHVNIFGRGYMSQAMAAVGRLGA